jgi:O-antigen ligase
MNFSQIELSKNSLTIFIFLAMMEVLTGIAVVLMGYPSGLLLIPIVLMPISLFLFYLRPIYFYPFLIFFLPNYSGLGLPLQFFGPTYRFGEPEIGILEVTLITLFFLWLMNRMIFKKEIVVEKGSIDISLFLLFMWIILSIFWTPKAATGILQTLKVVRGFLIFFLTVNLIQDRKDIRIVTISWFLLGAALALFGIYQTMTHGLKEAVGTMFLPASPEQARMGGHIRTTTFFASADELGIVLNLSFVMGLILFLTVSSKIRKTILAFLMAAIAVTLVATFSRKSWLGMLAIIFMFGLYKRKILFFTLLPVVGIFVFAMLGGGAYVEALYNRFASFFLPVEEAIPGRLMTWSIAWEIYKQSPIIGNGIGSFVTLAPIYGSSIVFTHNFFLYLLVELGPLGTIFFILFAKKIISGLIRFVRTHTDSTAKIMFLGFSASLAVLVIQASFKTIGLANPMVWAILGMIVAFLRIEKTPPYAAEVAQ